MSTEGFIRAVYRIEGEASHAERLARAVAYEQTVELPEAQITDPEILEGFVGRIEGITPDPEVPGARRAHIAYPAALASSQLGQLFNLLYGNVSMYSGVRLLEATLPGGVLQAFHGPRYGVQGLRRITGVYGRPLLATAVKPRGSDVARLAQIVHDFAVGGGDIVKDDQNLVDDSFDSFRRRVDACATAVEKANAATGRHCLYLPHLAGRDEDLERSAAFIHARGLSGALICPLVVGLDRARSLAARYNLVFMAHPAMTGAYTNGKREGINHAFLLGTLFRLAGADASVFPSPGGRFDVTEKDCSAIRDALVVPLGGISPGLPAPAGGMRLELVPTLATIYGADAVLLIGGGLLGHPQGVSAGTKAFLQAIRSHFDERLVEPEAEPVSVCELPDTRRADIRPLIPVRQGFHWDGRDDVAYKQIRTLDFRGVRRVELVGKNGEPMQFELRYFELEPGGYTSLEKHVHTHVLIGVRGHGLVHIGDQRMTLGVNDVAYVAPLEVHQLRNEQLEPFGFYCIVDRERDHPMAP